MLTDLDYGVYSLLGIVSNLIFIALAWWALQSLNFEKFLRKIELDRQECCTYYLRSSLAQL